MSQAIKNLSFSWVDSELRVVPRFRIPWVNRLAGILGIRNLKLKQISGMELEVQRAVEQMQTRGVR